MPIYEYRCDKCDLEVTLTLTIREHEKGESNARSATVNPCGHFSAPSCLRHPKNPNRHWPSSLPPKRVRAGDRIGLRVAVSTTSVRVVASTFAYLSVLFAGLPLSYVSAQPRLEEPAQAEDVGSRKKPEELKWAPTTSSRMSASPR
jgi:hypothetical protein